MSQGQPPLSKKRTFFTAEQKREICLLKRNRPQPKNTELALQYSISPGQVCDILKGSERWLSTDPNSHQAKLKRTHILPAANIYEPLILWIEKALECNLNNFYYYFFYFGKKLFCRSVDPIVSTNFCYNEFE